jgi:hypothetical protein
LLPFAVLISSRRQPWRMHHFLSSVEAAVSAAKIFRNAGGTPAATALRLLGGTCSACPSWSLWRPRWAKNFGVTLPLALLKGSGQIL